uniref:Uncharacterized protein n=1 Tax=Chenopodium quinoa TaxID=63459 RepID=A0A803MA14_CHEQI
MIQLIPQQDVWWGETPLHYAVREGNIEFFKLLFEYQQGQQEATVMTPMGFNPGLSMQNNEGNTPLHLALIKGKDDVALLLAKHCPDLTRSRKNNDGNTPLHVAAEVGNTECFKLLLEYDLKQAEVTNKDGNTPLHVAFLKSNLPIEKREDLSSKYLDMIKLMIEKESCVACMQDAIGATPLHRAASITSTYTQKIIRLILDKCPQSVMEVRNNSSKTILHVLKTIPSYKEAKALLDIPELFGLINHQDNDGNTPLHWAAMNLNHNMVRALLDSSAEQSIRRNNDGITAESLIQEQFEVRTKNRH